MKIDTDNLPDPPMDPDRACAIMNAIEGVPELMQAALDEIKADNLCYTGMRLLLADHLVKEIKGQGVTHDEMVAMFAMKVSDMLVQKYEERDRRKDQKPDISGTMLEAIKAALISKGVNPENMDIKVIEVERDRGN
jgi:hypothetical protein